MDAAVLASSTPLPRLRKQQQSPVCRFSISPVYLQVSLQLLAGPTAPATAYGTLAQTLHSLAQAATAAPRSLRVGLRLKLLSLFNDVGLAVGSEAREGLVAADLGELLPALAAACRCVKCM